MEKDVIKREAIAGWKAVREIAVRHGDFGMEKIAKEALVRLTVCPECLDLGRIPDPALEGNTLWCPHCHKPEEASCQVCKRTEKEVAEGDEKMKGIIVSGDPLQAIEIKYDTGHNVHERGVLAVCWLCRMAVEQTIQIPIFENTVKPLAEALRTIRVAVDSTRNFG